MSDINIIDTNAKPSKKTGWHKMYIIPILYLLFSYITPVVFLYASRSDLDLPPIGFWAMFVPILVLGVLNIRNAINHFSPEYRYHLLNVAVMQKYCMVPLFVVGFIIMSIMALLTFTPVGVIFLMVSPFICTVLFITGVIILICTAPYTIGYMLVSKDGGVARKAIRLACTVCQFIFFLDFMAVALLCIAEKKWRKLGILVLSICLLVILAAVILLIVLIAAIVGAF